MDAAEVKSSLLDYADGTCRDINFAGSTWAGVGRLLAWIGETYDHVSAVKCNSTGILEQVADCQNPEALLQAPRDSLSVGARSPEALLRDIQVFICLDEYDAPDVELTFFPRDVDQETFSLPAFIELVQKLSQLLEATKFFVRSENASWKFGDCGTNSGVIFTSESDICRQSKAR